MNPPCRTCGSTTGPQFYGIFPDGPYCTVHWGAYFQAHRDELTLQKGVQALFGGR